MLGAALASLGNASLAQAGADPGPAAGITLRPRGPLYLRIGAADAPPACRKDAADGHRGRRGRL
jgi:hypothetical protein